MTMFNDSVKRAVIGSLGALVLGMICIGAATAPAIAAPTLAPTSTLVR